MPVYEYTALDAAGKVVKGMIDSESSRAARVKLRKQGIYPTALNLVESSEQAPVFRKEIRFRPTRLKAGLKDVALFTRQMSTLIASGLPLVEALGAQTEQVENVNLRRIVTDVREKVNEGAGLADAMARYPGTFSSLYTNMVRAGETSGTLEIVFQRLADYLENQMKLRGDILATLTYPIFLLVVMSLIVTGLVTFLMPKVVKVFADMGQTLPIYTKILIAATDFLRHWWWAVFALLAGLGFGVRSYLKTETGQEQFDQLKLNLPLFGRVTRMIAVSRFARTLSTLIAGGIPLLTSFDIVKNIVNNRIIARAIEAARDNIAEGASIADPLRKSGVFPPMVIHMIAVGERSGDLENMLTRISEAYDREVETTVSGLTSILGPVIILIMAAVVFFIMISILIPIFQMSNVIH
jgi:general secretion pathway protein F